ncbi:MAG: hypothetical protein V4537_14640 [Pseudomonadota bacterium]
MTRHYATVCRDWQLPILLASMRRHCGDFLLHTLDWDWAPRRPLESPAMPEVSYTPRIAFLDRHPEYSPDLLPGPPRRPVDEVVTMRWRFFADVMEATGEPLTCIDGDLWFWSSPEPMFVEIGAAGLAVSPHDIPRATAGLPGVTHETHRRYGLWNAGLVYMADPSVAEEMARLNREWSYTEVRERADGDYDFGDQGHLERVILRRRPEKTMAGVHSIQHPGVNAAPWNIHRRGVSTWDGQVKVGHLPLIAYHYSSFRPGAQLADEAYEITARQAELLYAPYIAEVERWKTKTPS